MTALLAAGPILSILILMLGLRWSAARAGTASLLVTALLAVFVFGYGQDLRADIGVAAAVAGSLAEATWISLTILWIIFAALCIFELQSRNGGLAGIRQSLARLSQDPRLSAFMVAWFFALFMEGAAGFGTSAALAAPFLVSAGYRPVEAVAIALVGHALGVTFGAVGTPILPQLAVTPFEAQSLAAAVVPYAAITGLFLGAVVTTMITRGAPGSPITRPRFWTWGLTGSLLFLLPYCLIALMLGPELPTLVGALAGAMIFVLALKLRSATVEPPPREVERHSGPGLARSAAPYLILIGLVLASRLLPSVNEGLQRVAIGWQLGGYGGQFSVLYHPGTLLFASFLLGAWVQKTSLALLWASMRTAGARLLPVIVALVTMLGLSRLMVHAGMIDALAESAVAILGSGWPLVAALVGLLGTFVTGSATASNILFSDFQYQTARQLDAPPLPLLGAQTFGAAMGNMICPHNIVAAGAVVNLRGQESEVLRRTLWVALTAALIAGLIAWLSLP
ncbi:MAG: L-lactate permease [Wenzhouxiangella sp.]